LLESATGRIDDVGVPLVKESLELGAMPPRSEAESSLEGIEDLAHCPKRELIEPASFGA
jgi:hypothetical protein